MADADLTEEEEDKLDGLMGAMAMFVTMDPLMPLPMIQVMLLVCRYEGEGAQELSAGYLDAVVQRHIHDLGEGDKRHGIGPYELVEYDRENRKTHLTPKGVEFRKRLLCLLNGGAGGGGRH
jgi:hypothetical protein